MYHLELSSESIYCSSCWCLSVQTKLKLRFVVNRLNEHQMTILLGFLINTPSSYEECHQFVLEFRKYNIRCLLMALKMHEEYLKQRQVINKALFDYQLVEDFKSIQDVLLRQHITTVISDKLIDNNKPDFVCGQIFFAKKYLYLNGKQYSFNDLDALVIDLAKFRGAVTTGVKYNNDAFLFSGEQQANAYCFSYLQPNPYLSNLYPSVFLTWCFSDSTEFVRKWKHLTQHMHLTDKQNEANYCVVVNSSSIVPPTNCIYFCMEPRGEGQHLYGKYIDKLKATNNLMFLGTHDRHLNNCEFHLAANVAELKTMEVEKKFDKVLSVVVSSKNFDPGHKYRLALIHKLDKLTLPFELHIYGRCQNQNFRNYKGELPEQSKDDAMFPYKYHLNVENQYIPNYITEKLYDTIGCECLLFYKGAPNWTRFFDNDCLIELSGDETKLDDDVKLITDTIMGDQWEKRLDSIRRNKARILNEYSFEPRVVSIIQMVRTHCYVPSRFLVDYCLDEGFKIVKQYTERSNLVEKLTLSLNNNASFLLLQTSTLYLNLFDKLCFAFAGHGTTCDGFALNNQTDETKIDVCLLPLGCEKAINNARSNKPFLLSLKLIKIDI